MSVLGAVGLTDFPMPPELGTVDPRTTLEDIDRAHVAHLRERLESLRSQKAQLKTALRYKIPRLWGIKNKWVKWGYRAQTVARALMKARLKAVEQEIQDDEAELATYHPVDPP
jgi:hypothetical protein